MSSANLVDQTPGNRYATAVYSCAVALSSSVAQVAIPFPFVTANINYDAAASAGGTAGVIGLETVGTVTVNEYQKYNTVIRLKLSGSFTSGRSYMTYGTLVITFA